MSFTNEASRAGRISGSRRRADHVITWIRKAPLTERDLDRIAVELEKAERLDAAAPGGDAA